MTTGTLRELAEHLGVPYEPFRRRVQRANVHPVGVCWVGQSKVRVYRLDDVARVQSAHDRRIPTRLHARLTRA